MKKGKSYKSKYIKENLYKSHLVVPKHGKDITIGTIMPEIFISENENIFCYTGICIKRKPSLESCFIHPSYTIGKHSTDKEILDKVKGFYRLTNGHIVIDNYIDNGPASGLMHKRLPACIRLHSQSSNYGIFINETEDRNLTRAVFGLCHDELLTLIESYAKALGSYTEFETYPTLTRSLKSHRFCDMTEVWIPEEFPFIVFEGNFHVSLYGFYKHIKLLTNCMITSKVSRMLIDSGLDEYILEQVFDIEQYTDFHTIPSKNFFRIL